jgi:DNA-directed DNA polymerase III PolC
VADSFTHLHVHTEYSMLDGAARLDELVAAAAADGQPALGITDHGNMYGILDFYRACKDQGVKPILGTEAYMAHDHRTERIAARGKMDDSGGEGEGGKKPWYHLTLLAESEVGYKNLIQLASRSFMEGYYRKPKVDWELLEEHSEGLIATTGCLGGHVLQAMVPKAIMDPDKQQTDPLSEDERFDNAVKLAGRLQDIFGRDNLFVELQDHGIPAQQWSNPRLAQLAKAIRAPLLATNDSHYVHREDALSHDALLCVQTNSLVSDKNRFKFHGDDHYLKSAEEMRYLFRELPTACDNTLWVAERCEVEIEFGKPQLPNFPLPPGFETDDDYLRHLVFEGAQKRWGDNLDDKVTERLLFELKVIGDMGFSSYFLITWDLIKHARDNQIRVGPGRGSAAGCAVAYTLWITDLDPIKYDLLFERFLNPSRISMPDIDMDFDTRYRDEMIRYAAERYGRENVAQIITFGTIKARQAVRDAARVLGHDYGTGDRIAKAMPPLIMGRDTPLYACLEEHPKYVDGFKMATEIREMYSGDPISKEVIDVAKGLEGLRRSDGIHAAAVVITKEPLTTYLPIQRKPEPGKPIEEAPVVTQYEMHGVEDLGLLKMDFLGLRNLDIISDALELIEMTRGEQVDIDTVDLEDEPTYDLLRAGQTVGVFQLESPPMRALMRSLSPDAFEDVAALVALYRPGPMAANMHNDYADRKNGRKEIEYLHPDAEEILGSTYGLMIYQESVMRIAQKFAGYSLAEADNLRKACLPRGTKILTTRRGYMPIEKVMSLEDRRVQTIDQRTATTRHEAVEDVWSVGTRDVYRLTTSTGYTIEATDNHPFLVEDDWTELKNIDPGDLVAVAAHTSTQGGSRTPIHEVELAALLISEGYCPDPDDPARGGGHFTNTDPHLIELFENAYEDFFGVPHRRRSVANGVTQLGLTKPEMRALGSVIGSYGLAGDKTIPDSIVNAPLHEVERFLGLYFCADGWADKSGVHYGTKSLAVAKAVKRMLLRCAVVSNILHRDIPDHGRHYTVSVVHKSEAKRFGLLIEPHLTYEKLTKVERHLYDWESRGSATNIGIPSSFVRNELERRARATARSKQDLGVDSGGYTSVRLVHPDTLNGLLYSERLEDLRTGDLRWDTVVSVEYVGAKECFDFRMANPDRPYAVVEDFLVHNCGKKIRELIVKERQKFEEGCEANGYGRELGKEWFDIIEPFADYAFNKSHSYGYGFIAYQIAYLKANYPAEYMSALLTSVKSNLDKAAVYLAECRAMEIPVTVADVNRSLVDFAPELRRGDDGGIDGAEIVFGMSAVRGVGTGHCELIIAEREANGAYADFYDFCERVDLGVLNKKTVEALIKAGAFDSVGHPRQGLLMVFESIIDRTIARRKEAEAGVMSLFDSMGGGDDSTSGGGGFGFDEREEIPDIEFQKAQKLAFEKEMLGLYVSDHPLFGAEDFLARRTEVGLDALSECEDGAIKTVGGVITNLQRKWTKKGDLMGVFVLEDLRANVETMVFPRTMTEHGHKLEDDAIVIVKARIDKRDDMPKLIAMEIEVVEGVSDSATPFRLRVMPNRLTAELIAQLKEILLEHPGDHPVLLHLGDDKVLRLPPAYGVDAGSGLVSEIRVLLGPAALVD